MCAAKKDMASPVHVFTASQAGIQSLPCVRPLLSLRRKRPGQLVLKLSMARFAWRASTCKVPICGPRTAPKAAALVPSPDCNGGGNVASGVDGIGLAGLSSAGRAKAAGPDNVAGPPLGMIPLEQADRVSADKPRAKRARFIARMNQTESVSSSFQLRLDDFTSRMNVQISCVSTASVIEPPMIFPSASLTKAAMSASKRTDTRAIGWS